MLFSMCGAIFLVWLKRLWMLFSYILYSEVMTNDLYLFHHSEAQYFNTLAPICASVTFESQKTSAASRAVKLLFFVFCWKGILVWNFYLLEHGRCSVPPSKCVHKIQVFLNITLSTCNLPNIMTPNLGIYEYPDSSFWFVQSCCSIYKLALLEDLCQLLSKKRFFSCSGKI